MKRIAAMIVGVTTGAWAAAACAQAGMAPDLDGLWVAREVRSTLGGSVLLFEHDGGFSAEVAGFRIPASAQDGVIRFELPDGKGGFRGVRNGDEIRGHWISARLAAAGARFATPLTLRRSGPRRWQATIHPLADQMTYFLPLVHTADGSYGTHLRNPERNLGRFVPVSRLTREGEAIALRGVRRGSRDESVLASGRYDGENDLLRIVIAGRSLDFERDTDSSSPFYPRSKNGERYVYRAPPALDDGWKVSTLDKEGLDRAAIERFVQLLIDLPMDGLSAHQVHSVLIARHGKLVLEEYFHGAGRDEAHDLRSASKSWTAMLIGAAMHDGVPIRLDTPVYSTLSPTPPPAADPRRQALTLEHLISMTAGFDCNDSGERPGDEDVMQAQTAQPDWYRYALAVPLVRDPGDTIVYCSMKPNLAAGMLEKIAGEPLPELFQRLIARPLRMTNYHLFLQPTGQAYGGGGHRFTSRDFLKFAQLMLNDGEWHGKRIFSREWARQSAAPLHLLNPETRQTYGYLWNSVAYAHDGRSLHAFFAGGNGGQVSIGIPALDLAIVFTGGNYSDRVLFRSQQVYVPQYILPAILRSRSPRQ